MKVIRLQEATGVDITVGIFGGDILLNAFESRVEADGGVFETGCVLKGLQQLYTYSTMATYGIPYKIRVEADSGTVEGLVCLTEKIDELL